MKTTTFSYADLEAYRLLSRAGIFPMTTDTGKTAIDAGNYIIQLAEKIKCERLALAMQR